MRPSLQTRFTFFMYRFHPFSYSPFRNPQSVSNFLVCPICTFEFQRSIPTSLFPIWNANLSCAHDCILSCSQGDPINAALYITVYKVQTQVRTLDGHISALAMSYVAKVRRHFHG